MSEADAGTTTYSDEARRACVYIVDDDAIVRLTIRKGLEKLGFECEDFSGARDFIEGLTRRLPDCVLLDLRMPVMGGIELLETLRARDAEFPVIILTPHADYEKAVSSIKLGAADFLEKPCDFVVIANKIASAISEKKLKRSKLSKSEIARNAYGMMPPKERQIAEAILSGSSYSKIANDIGISLSEVERSVKSIMGTLGAESFPDLVRVLRMIS